MATKLCGRRASDARLMELANTLASEKVAAKLVIIQVGANPASSSYIRQKERAAKKSTLDFEHLELPRSSTAKDIEKSIEKLNADASVTAFMLQLPLDVEQPIPPNEVSRLLDLIAPEKDADGLHSLNQGRVFTGESNSKEWTSPIPATALGICRLLEHYQINPSSLDAVVIGRSRLVGMPTSALLTHLGATTTVCHSKSKSVAKKTQKADLIVAAAGVRHLLRAEDVKEGVVVVDVGIHVDDAAKLSGDVHPDVHKISSAFSPVPGGVGPMTVAGLIENTIQLAIKKN